MKKPAISARIDEKTKEMLERYKEEEELTTSEATQRLLRQNLNVKYGEGDILFSDGGTKLKGEIEETQDQLGEVEKTVDELKDGLEDDISQNNLSYLLLTAGLVYIIIQTSFSVPSSLTIPVGIGLIGGLLYVNLLR
jgi:hypothetical protein